MTYAGLTTADKPALLDAKARGAKWAARDKDDELVGFRLKPQKYVDMELNSDHRERTQAGNDFDVMPSDEPLQFIQWSDTEPVNIDLALAQIAEMESKQNNALSEKANEKGCLTMNERINQMTVEEKAKYFVMRKWVGGGNCYIAIDNSIHERRSAAESRNRKHLKSPYTEGETE